MTTNGWLLKMALSIALAMIVLLYLEPESHAIAFIIGSWSYLVVNLFWRD